MRMLILAKKIQHRMNPLRVEPRFRDPKTEALKAQVPPEEHSEIRRNVGDEALKALWVTSLTCFFLLWIPISLWNTSSRILIPSSFSAYLLYVIVLGVVAYFCVMLTLDSRIEKRKLSLQERLSETIQIENRNSVHEAERITTNVITIYDDSKSKKDSLIKLLSRAKLHIDIADREFQERAFSPFWEAIETATAQFVEYNNTVRELTASSQSASALLKSRNHSFPTFPVAPTDIPDPNSLAQKLRGVVRRAQQDFQFASIQEQRKTHQAIIAGFSSLTDAVERIGGEIEWSIRELGSVVQQGFDTMGAGMEKIIESQSRSEEQGDKLLKEIGGARSDFSSYAKKVAKDQEKQSEILDDIRRGRKPTGPEPRPWTTKPADER